MFKSHQSTYFFSKFIFLFFAAVAFASCSTNKTGSEKQFLARVGNEYLKIQEAKEAIPAFVFKQDSAGALEKYREKWIHNQVLLQEADRLGLAQKEEVQSKLAKARKEVLKQALKDYIIGSAQGDTVITDQEARSYYQANKDQFALDEKFVRFRHMRARTSKDARAAKQDLLYAVPWPEVAREYAINPEAVINESQQFWPLSMAVNNIDIMNRYLNVIGQDEISPIQRVDGVYHFVQLTDSRAKGEQPDLDWLMGQIKDWLILTKRRRHFNSYVKNLYLKAKSNNEVETFNVLPLNSNQKSTIADTLESTSTDE